MDNMENLWKQYGRETDAGCLLEFLTIYRKTTLCIVQSSIKASDKLSKTKAKRETNSG
jgi:hypothetical protein